MAQKRRNGNEADDMTSREKKKLKLSVARTIATQAGPSQISSRTIPTNSVFIKYSTNLRGSHQVSGMAGMPSAIDIEKFVEVSKMLNDISTFEDLSRRQARAFEIDAMHTAMKTARYIHCP